MDGHGQSSDPAISLYCGLRTAVAVGQLFPFAVRARCSRRAIEQMVDQVPVHAREAGCASSASDSTAFDAPTTHASMQLIAA